MKRIFKNPVKKGPPAELYKIKVSVLNNYISKENFTEYPKYIINVRKTSMSC